MRNAKSSTILLCALFLALLLYACGTSNREGAASGTADTVAHVSETLCITCHSTSLERLTGDAIVAKYEVSVHNLNSVGCQDCHGGGAQHNGVGPIPFPSPNYVQCSKCHDSDKLVTKYAASKHLGVQIENEAGEPCQRCHTHQGAVLAARFGFTGDGTVMDGMVNAPGLITNPEPIKCNTCHETHDPKTLRIDAGWQPSATVGSAVTSTNDQYRLCTQCHGYINPAGALMGSGTTTSGTARVGHHETSWYRIIGATHYDDPATAGIEGYTVRTTDSNPCFDCHGHEAKTNSNNDPASASYNAADTTIYTDWAQSAHAGNILTAKYAAAAANPVDTTLSRTDPLRVAQGLAQVDSVMTATSSGAWNKHNGTTCNRCHTAPGIVALLATPSGSAQPALTVGQVLTCWGCHSNAANGTLRTLAGTKANTNYTTDLGWNPIGYTLNYGKKAYPDVAASNLCITCHDARENDPGAITDASTTYLRTHNLQAAATMYVKMGFITFATGSIPGVTIDTSLLSDQDGGTITSYHRILGTPAIIGQHGITAAQTNLTSNGPCVTCHFNGGDHSLQIDQKIITAVCNNCHDSEGGHAITTIADFKQYFLEPQSAAYQAAITLAITIFNNKNAGITIAPDEPGSPYVRAFLTGTTTEAKNAADWTALMSAPSMSTYNQTRVMGAVSNILLFQREPGAYAHARTYSRRLLYDTLDYLDNGVMDQSVGATALAESANPSSPVYGLFGKGTTAFTDSTLTTLAPGTTEAMVFLIKWDRSGATAGQWNATAERP